MARKKIGELVVRRSYPLRVKLFLAGLTVVLLIFSGWLLYDHGLSMAGFERSSALRRQQELADEIRRLRDDSQQLRESLARAERTLQTDQIAYQELERSLSESAKQIVKLREEISFYRNILSPENKISGLQIHSLNLERAGGENDYRYRLVLIQALKHDQVVTGSGTLEINGTQAGESAVLHFPQAGDKPIRVNFKYFQEIEGLIRLPRNFKPVRVKVNVTTAGPTPKTVEQTYHWPQP